MKQRVVHAAEEIDQLVNDARDEMEEHGLLARGAWRTPVTRVSTDAILGFADGLHVIRASRPARWAGYRSGGLPPGLAPA